MSNDIIKKRRWDFSTPDAIFDVEGIDIYAQTIYILLCSHADREGKSFPAYDTLAKRGRMSRRKAISSVATLVDRGLLLKEDRERDNGGDASNLYTIVDAYDFLTSESPKNNEGGAQHAPGGVHDMHGGGAQHAPKHNHLTLPSLNMIDCMSASAEIAVASESISLESEILESKHSEIYEALHEHAPKNCYIENNLPMGGSLIDATYLMLVNQFEMKLSPEVVQIACELYFDRACSPTMEGVTMRQHIENPVGFFQWCYKDAIKQYKASRNKRKGQASPVTT